MKKFFSGVMIVMLIIATVFVLQKKYHLFGILGIEQMTEEHYRVHIGYRNDELNEQNIPIFVEINGDFRFTQQTQNDE